MLAYAHLVVDLGYRDIVLAGDSAGGELRTDKCTSPPADSVSQAASL